MDGKCRITTATRVSKFLFKLDEFRIYIYREKGFLAALTDHIKGQNATLTAPQTKHLTKK